jgi:lysophospholipase L1-like esterase
VGIAGVVALGGLLWAWHVLRQDDVVLYRGGLVAHAVLSAVVILACTQPGPVRALLSLPPLRALGRISYGVYLYHWPVFVWMDRPVVVEVAVTLALAVVSYVVLEQPIRQRRVRVPLLAAPSVALLVVGVVVASTLHPPRPASFDLASAAEASLPPDPRVEPDPSAARVAMFGDSTALRTGFGLKGWGWYSGTLDMRDGGAGDGVGCPLVSGGVVDYVVARQAPEPICATWPDRWAAIVEREDLDAAVVQIGPWDVTDRELDGEWTHIGEPAYDARLEREIERAVDVLSAKGALVIWLTAPHIEFGRGQAGIPRDSPISEPARMDRLNQLIGEVDARRDEMVVLDLVAHIRSLPGGEMDASLRPDGVHFSEDAAPALARWLAPEILRLIDERR